MGATNSFWGPINAKLEQRHQDAMDQQKAQREAYQSVIQDPNTSDDTKNWAWDQWQKTLHPDVRKKFGPLQPIVQKIFGGIQQQQQTQTRPPANTSPIPAPQGPVQATGQPIMDASATGGMIPNPNPQPTPIFDTAAANQRALALAQQKSDIEQARQVAVQQAKPQPGMLGKPQEYRNPDDASAPPMTVQQHNRTGQFFDLQGSPTAIPEGYKPYKAPTAGNRQKFTYSVTGPDGKPQDLVVFQDQKTQQAYNVQGKPIDIPEGAVPVDEGARVAKLRADAWGTGEFNKLVKSFKSQNPDLTDEQADSMAGAWVQEAEKRRIENIGAQRTTERPMVVNGQMQPVPFASGPVARPIPAPVPPGAPPAASAAPAGALPHATPIVPNGTPSPRPAPQTTPRSAPAAAVPPAAASGARDIGVPPAQYRAAQQDVRAISAASVPIFGDPTQPGLTSLQDYSDLARDPAAVKRVGAATQIISMLPDDSIGNAHASVSGGGINIGLGPLTELIQNSAGVPQKVAEQRANILINALKSMTPREREYYNALLTAKESIVGLRKGTSGSGTKFAVDAMAKTLPAIGQNVVDEAGYKDLLKRQAGIFVDASRGQLKNAMTPEQKAVFDRLGSMNSQATPSGKPVAAPRKPAKTADEYLKNLAIK